MVEKSRQVASVTNSFLVTNVVMKPRQPGWQRDFFCDSVSFLNFRKSETTTAFLKLRRSLF